MQVRIFNDILPTNLAGSSALSIPESLEALADKSQEYADLDAIVVTNCLIPEDVPVLKVIKEY